MSTRSGWFNRFVAVAAVGLGLAAFPGFTPPAHAADIAGYQEFFIPGDEQQLFSIMVDNDNNTALVSGSGMHCVIGVVGSGTNSILYYDHWEDGYDFTLTNPATADETVVLTNIGQVVRFESSAIPLTGVTNAASRAAFFYDGRDRIVVAGSPVTVTRATWPESIGTVYCSAFEILPVKPFMNSYTVPVGERLNDVLGYRTFTNVYVIVQAMSNNTVLVIDDPAIGGIQYSNTLQRGQVASYFHAQAVGTTVNGNGPLQVQLLSGHPWTGGASQMDGTTLVPSTLWEKEYYCPVGSGNRTQNDDRVALYIYNPNTNAINVTYSDLAGTSNFTVAATSTLWSAAGTAVGRYVRTNSGAYLSSTQTFWAIGYYGEGTTSADRADYDWGFGLVPASILKREYFLGWAPGSSEATPTVNGSPMWVTPQFDNTTIYADYSPVDGIANSTQTLSRLQIGKFLDPDFQNTGMRIWSDKPFAGAWGEDSAVAGISTPYLDCGYTTLPSPEQFVDVVLALNKSVNPAVVNTNAGQRVTFAIAVGTENYAVTNVNIFDTLPPGWNYVTNTTTVTYPDLSVSNGPNPAITAGGTNLAWNLGASMAANQSLTLTFDATTRVGLVQGTISRNVAGARGNGPSGFVFSPEDDAFVYTASIGITKTTSGGTLLPGQTNTYTVVVTNQGNATLTGIEVVDALPSTMTYLPNSTRVIGYKATNLTTVVTNDNIAGGTFPDLNNGVPPNLLVAADNFAVPTNRTLTVEFRAVVVNPLPQGVTDILNTAGTRSTQVPEFKYSTVTNPVPSAGAIGDYVWLDEDGDGDQDAGEAGIANVRVLLTGTNIFGETVSVNLWTDSNGGYLFPGLYAGSYTVRVDTATMPAGLAANQTFDPDSTTNNQTVVSLAAGQNVRNADFGYNWVPPGDSNGGSGTGAIGDRVWIDADGDGIQDAGEASLTNVTVQLYRDADTNGTYETLVATTNTGTTGHYVFDALAAGAYQVVATPPAGYTQTGDPDYFGKTLPAGARDNRTTTPIVVGPGDVFVNADFGYQPATSYTIGDTIFFDTNGDGTNNVADYGIAGVSVALIADLNADGVWDTGEPILATDVTDTSGLYSFPGLPNGPYIVWVSDAYGLLQGMAQSVDPDPTKDGRSAVNLSGADNLNQDFGYTLPGHSLGEGLIGDTVFLDRDGDGVPDAGEGLEGVRVQLYDVGGNLLSSVLTSENGTYAFGGLGAGIYRVRVDTSTLPGTGLSNTTDPDGGTANESFVTIGGVQPLVNLSQDFGYRDGVNPNSISGTLWEDRDADGTLEGGESARFAGVTVALLTTNGTIIGTSLTDASGNYVFTNLPDGTFRVDVTDTGNLLNGYWKSTGATPGADNNSQVDPYTVTLSGGTVNTTGDFGYHVDGAAVGNRVWQDANTNGSQDSGETGMSNVVVRLTIVYANGTTNVLSTLSDTNGFYSFGNLLLDEDHNGGVGSPQYILSAVDPGGGYNHTTFNKSGVPAALNSDYPVGTLAVPTKGVVSIPINADPSLEASAGWIDFGFTLTPTLAVITAVRARVEDGVAVISWDVSLELDTAGYYLDRRVGGAWQRVNAALIPPQLFVSGTRTYEQADPGASPGSTQSYRIIELDNRGRLLPYGPYDLKLDGGGISYATWTAEVAWNGADADPDADPDRDRLTNLQEYLAGTDPLSANSVLRVNRAEAVAEGLRLTWNSKTGRVYAVEMTLSLDQPFVAIASGLASDPPENSYVVPVDPDAVKNAYFRVVVSQP